MWKVGKRIVDVLWGICGCIFFLVLFPIIGCAIIIDSGFPILVRLNRVSNGKIIGVYKFRSMVKNAHAMKPRLQHLNERKDGPLFKIKNDPRLTRVGRILRKFRLDEVPQFINVLKGDMSLVGPRPHEIEEIAAYPEEYKCIACHKAGLTGLSQVNGASALPFKKELEYDKEYIQFTSFKTDAKIVGKTIKIFFSDPTGV